MSDHICPTLEQLVKELKDVTNWYVFGVSLGIPVRKLDTIKKECSDVEEQKIKMFQFWLRNKLDASWKKVIQALELNDNLVLAATLGKKYLLSKNEQVSLSTEANERVHEAEIWATAAVVERLRNLEFSFSSMLTDLRDLFTECKCDLSKAQFFLDDQFDTERFSRCANFDRLLRQLRKDHVDTFNTCYLQQLVACFKKDQLIERIKKYETEKEAFLNDTTVIEFQHAVVSRLEPVPQSYMKHLTIKISEELAKDRTLKDIERLARRGFDQCQLEFVCIHVKSGSVIISWFFPEALSDKLMYLAQKNVAVFKDAGVDEVTVDGRVVYPTSLLEGIDIPAPSLKEVYTDYYHRLVEAVSDEHTCQSLLTRFSPSALISGEKIAQLSSSRVTGSSFLKTLGLEEEPHLLVPLVSAMSRVEQQQTLAEKMFSVMIHAEKPTRLEDAERQQLISDKADLLNKLKCYKKKLKDANESIDLHNKTEQHATEMERATILKRHQSELEAVHSEMEMLQQKYILTVELLVVELQEMNDEWRLFGVAVGISTVTLDAIQKKDPHGGVGNWKIEMFQSWLQFKENASWYHVVQALEIIRLYSLAAYLRDKYGLPDSPSEQDIMKINEEQRVQLEEARETIKKQYEKLKKFRESDDQKGGNIHKRLSSLENQFTFLVVHALKEFRNGDFRKVKRQLEIAFSQSDFSSFVSFDLLFKFLHQKHLNEFNTFALEVVINFLPPNIQYEYQLFQEERQNFYRSVTVFEFEEACFCHREFPNDMESLVIKLTTSKAKMITMEQLQEHVQNTFGENAKYLGQVVATRGSGISVSWLLSRSVIQELLHTFTTAESGSQHHPDWIQQVKIGGKIIYKMHNENPEEDQEEDQCREPSLSKMERQEEQISQLLKELREKEIEREKDVVQISQLRTEVEKLTKNPTYDSMMKMTQEWGQLEERFRNVQSTFSVISQQSENPNAKRARKICEMQKELCPLILIPVTGPKENGKTDLLNAILGGSIVHKNRKNYKFPIYVEHVPELHLYCPNTKPCKFCPRLEKSNGEVLATGWRNVLFEQEKLLVPEKGMYYIIKTKIPMLENIPRDFPFTVYLADCPGECIYHIAEIFDLSAVLTPAVICAVSSKKYMADKRSTLESAKQSLQFTYMAVDANLSKAHVLFAATFCEDYMNNEDDRPVQMKDELKSLRPESRYYPVAAKWARKAREYMNEPEREGLDAHMKAAWKWVQRKEVVEYWINPDKVVELAIGRFENGIKQSIVSMNISDWVVHLKKLSEKMNPETLKMGFQRDSSVPKFDIM